MAIYSKLIEGLTNGEEHFIKVFTANHKGRVNNRVDLPVASVIPSAFPAEPTEYTLINTYSSSTTLTAPEDGFFRIVAQGASGKGGNGSRYEWGDNSDEDVEDYLYSLASGGGGGGGGCSVYDVKLKKGDTISITPGAVGSTTRVVINSSIEGTITLAVTSGGNGTAGSTGSQSATAGSGGSGGVGSGGQKNYTGSKGTNGSAMRTASSADYDAVSGGTGGAPGYSGGRQGGRGGAASTESAYISGSNGSNGFVQIYRGNTNIVA